ncbi:HdeD family acid-resistance protein [Anaerorhabdus sp.]|uniref:HdeD family acid-resistance protein n=1 Tax=Anaerorhabdus sp. TaxID=1872524 RepID=UPI002FCA4C3B
MENVLKGAKEYVYIQSIGSILFGLFLMIWPFKTTAVSLYIGAGLLFVLGVFGFISYFVNRKKEDGTQHADWSIGLLQILLAILIFLFPVTVAASMTYLIGGYIVLNSILNATKAIQYRKHGLSNWGWIVAFNLFTLLGGFYIFVNPFIGFQVILQVSAILLITKGIIDMIAYNMMMKELKGVHSF